MKIDDLYTSDNWYNMPYILSQPYPFILLIGARGTGKTYGANKYILDNGKRFMYLRRTLTEYDIAVNDKRNPFQVYDSRIVAERMEKGLSCIYSNETKEEVLGYASALSTFHNLRSVDFSDVEIIIYDECIPEKHVKAIKNEYDVILNMYETINRNREMQGKPPVKLVMMSNSNDISHPIIRGLQIADSLFDSDTGIIEIPERGLLVIYRISEGFKQKKSNTALYRLADTSSGFSKMALDNKFNSVNKDNIQRINRKEYKPVYEIITDGKHYYILCHKSEVKYYVSTFSIGNSIRTYNTDIQADLTALRSDLMAMLHLRLKGLLYFENIDTKIMFDSLFLK